MNWVRVADLPDEDDDGCVCTLESCAGETCDCKACIEQAESSAHEITCHCDICDDGT